MDRKRCSKNMKNCVSGVSYLVVITTCLGCVAFLFYFINEYSQIRHVCIEEWGDAADWCKVKVYHSNGLFNAPSCGCRVIVPPNCGSGLNKTLPGDVFTKLGSAVTVAMFGGYCDFYGPIPSEIGELDNLELLFLGVNRFNGTLPASLGNLKSTQYLGLSQNELKGEIPAWIGNMKNLEILLLNNNQLEGEIPEKVVRLFDENILEFRVYNNNLSGNLTVNLSDYDQFSDWTEDQRDKYVDKKIVLGNNFTIVTQN